MSSVKNARRAIELEDNDRAHSNLGLALMHLGQFDKALPHNRRAARESREEFGTNPFVGHWVEFCEKVPELEKRLLEVLSGSKPKGWEENADLALYCFYKKRYHAAVRFFEQVLAADPKHFARTARPSARWAAIAAINLAEGKSVDGEELDDAARAAWRRKAQAWLRARLDVFEGTLLDASFGDRSVVRKLLLWWKRDPHLAPVHTDGQLARLPYEDRQEWKDFWADVDRVLVRARN